MREILQPHHRVLELADSVDRYIGTDVASKMVEIAQGKLTEQSPQNLSFAVQDAGAMTSGSNDVVLALNLLHLLPDLENTLAEIYKALPSGGLLISKTGLLKDGLWLLPLVIPLMRAIGKAPFVRSLSEESLIGLLENAGFKVTEKLVQGGMVPRVFIVAQKP
jgi:ubiquinone/menaquinone biosynthesis C-methylase UbiE